MVSSGTLGNWVDGPIDGGRRHIDVRNVIWLGTSNIGQDQIFEYVDTREEPTSDISLSREEYRELMALLRPRVSAKLGVRTFLHICSKYLELNQLLYRLP